MNPVALPAPGLHYGVPYEIYAKWDAANFSKIKPIAETASKCKWAMDHPKKPTTAMILGSAFHVAVLEPGQFEQLFYICPPCKKNTIEGKVIWDEAVKASGGREIIRQGSPDDASVLGQVEKLRGAAKSVYQSRAAMQFLECEGQNEVCALWRDEEAGIWCKARLDRYIGSYKALGGRPVIVEFKTCHSATSYWFGKDVGQRNYDAQAAGYRRGVKAITGKEPIHVFVAVENEAPFDIQTHILDDEGQQTGLRKYRQMITRFAECLKTGKWPGYPDVVNTLSTPSYEHNRSYEE